jgi:preprotein translocase subunit Sec63
MSSTDYNYDEQGQFFPFFILTLTGLVTLPLTYSLLRPLDSEFVVFFIVKTRLTAQIFTPSLT